jgi:putative flavoprotein involved in K+ transport
VGPAGFSTAGALKKRGLEAVVLEKYDAIGSSWLRRYDRLHLHTIRQFSGLARFPIPRSYPKYLSRDMYAEYLRSARAFQIDVELQFCCEEQLRWSAVRRGNESRHVARPNGCCRDPHVRRNLLPVIPELERYSGQALRTASYRTGRDYAGNRVLIVGLGNTAAELRGSRGTRCGQGVDKRSHHAECGIGGSMCPALPLAT